MVVDPGDRAEPFRVLGFRVLGFRVLGFRVLGFRVLGLRVLGLRVLGLSHRLLRQNPLKTHVKDPTLTLKRKDSQPGPTK